MLQMNDVKSSGLLCTGLIRYHKLENYGSKEAQVQFSYNPTTGERLVQSLPRIGQVKHEQQNQNETSSWVHKSEHDHNLARNDIKEESLDINEMEDMDDKKNIITTATGLSRNIDSTHLFRRPRRVSSPRATSNISKHTIKVNRSKAVGRRQSFPSTSYSTCGHKLVSQTVKEPVTTTKTTTEQISSDEVTNAVNSITVDAVGSDPTACEESSSHRRCVEEPNVNEEEETEVLDTTLPKMNAIETRLSLLEQRLVSSTVSPLALSTATTAVITSLRWEFLKTLEKPLKDLNCPNLSQYGITGKKLEVKTVCDYMSFKELSAHLSVTAETNAQNNRNSRIAYSPAFHVTQAGSKATDEMSILFSTLADLTSLLRIRDDRDHESILTTEVKTKHFNLFRYLGTYVIDENTSNKTFQDEEEMILSDKSSTSTRTSNSLRLFIGSAPVKFEKVFNAKVYKEGQVNSLRRNEYLSLVVEQKCTNFCPVQRCFLSTWVPSYVKSLFFIDCQFDEDGTVPCKELSKYFVLRWNRQNPLRQFVESGLKTSSTLGIICLELSPSQSHMYS